MDEKLSLINRLKLRLTGYVYIGDRMEEGWKDALPCYIFKCHKHGLVVSHVRGYNQYLECPECLKELRLELENNKKESTNQEYIHLDAVGHTDQAQSEIW